MVPSRTTQRYRTRVVAAACAGIMVTGALEPAARADGGAIVGGVVSSEPGPSKRERWRKGKIEGIVGGSMLGGGVFISILVATIQSLKQSFCGIGQNTCGGNREFGYTILPIAGPFVSMYTGRDALNAGGLTGLALLGGLEVLGAGLLIHGQVLRSDMPSSALTVRPLISPTNAGIALGGSF